MDEHGSRKETQTDTLTISGQGVLQGLVAEDGRRVGHQGEGAHAAHHTVGVKELDSLVDRGTGPRAELACQEVLGILGNAAGLSSGSVGGNGEGSGQLRGLRRQDDETAKARQYKTARTE